MEFIVNIHVFHSRLSFFVNWTFGRVWPFSLPGRRARAINAQWLDGKNSDLLSHQNESIQTNDLALTLHVYIALKSSAWITLAYLQVTRGLREQLVRQIIRRYFSHSFNWHRDEVTNFMFPSMKCSSCEHSHLSETLHWRRTHKKAEQLKPVAFWQHCKFLENKMKTKVLWDVPRVPQGYSKHIYQGIIWEKDHFDSLYIAQYNKIFNKSCQHFEICII